MQKISDPEFYRVVFFSSASIGVPFMQELIQDPRFEVVGVVTQPDKPVGRGLKLQPNIIKSQALEFGIPIEDIQTPNRINPEKSIE
jgi:methionyl-tRNA formyltransferase